VNLQIGNFGGQYLPLFLREQDGDQEYQEGDKKYWREGVRAQGIDHMTMQEFVHRDSQPAARAGNAKDRFEGAGPAWQSEQMQPHLERTDSNKNYPFQAMFEQLGEYRRIPGLSQLGWIVYGKFPDLRILNLRSP
jgi:hypothetical protein